MTNDIAVDPRTGDVWVASDGGVVRWDANRGTYAKYTSHDGLTANLIQSVAVDARTGDVWFGSLTGGASRLTRDGRWTTIRMADGLAEDWVSDIAVDPTTQSVWFATLGGATRRSADGHLTTYRTSDGLGSPTRGVANVTWAVAVDARTGNVWFGTDGGGVSRLAPDGTWTTFTTDVGLVSDTVWSLAIDSESGTVWAGHAHWDPSRAALGLSQYTPESGWSAVEAVGGEGIDLAFSLRFHAGTGDLWVGTNSGGAWQRTRDGAWLQHPPGSAPGSRKGMVDGPGWSYVRGIDFDPSTGDVWLATLHGVSRYLATVPETTSKRWVGYFTDDFVASNEIRSVGVNHATGELWIGTMWGLSLLEPNGDWRVFGQYATETSDRVYLPEGRLGSDQVIEVAVDAHTGDVWFGHPKGGGVTRRTKDGEWSRYTVADGLAASTVSAIAIDSDGGAWFGTGDITLGEGGLGLSHRSADGTWTTYSRTNGLAGNTVSDMAVNPASGEMYVATATGLSVRTKDGQWWTYRTEDGLSGNVLTALAIHPTTGDLWIGTTGGGISILSPGREWTYVGEADGLGSSTVTALEIDAENGEVWVGTDRGLSQRRSDGTWDHYGTEDGLAESHVKSLDVDAVTGELWIGTIGGVTRRVPVSPTQRCENAIPMSSSPQVVADIRTLAEADYYRMTVEKPFSRVSVSLSATDDALAVDVWRTCGGSAGTGSGRHIGTKSGEWRDGRLRMEFDSALQPGEYWFVVTPTSRVRQYPIAYRFQVSVAEVDPSSVRLLILSHRPGLASVHAREPHDPLLLAVDDRLRRIAGDPSLNGIVIDNLQTDTSEAVHSAYSWWQLALGEPSRTNGVASALRDWISKVRAQLPSLAFILLVGDDRVIPHGRVVISKQGATADGWVTEDAYLATAGIAAGSSIGSSLARDLTLSDDVYATAQPSEWQRGQLSYVPDLAVGRIVEDPADILATLDAYIRARGIIQIDSSLAAGYDFMSDAAVLADTIVERAGLPSGSRHRLDGNTWGLLDLHRLLVSRRVGLAFLGVHSTHAYHELPNAEFLRAEAIERSDVDRGGSLVISLACHGALNVPGQEHQVAADFARAWGSRGAALIGSTGWAYGLPEILAYQEILMTDLVSRLVAPSATTIGQALVDAKRNYAVQHEMNHLHAKTLAGTILYGLPFYRPSVNTGVAANHVLAATNGVAPSADPPQTPNALQQVAREVWLKPQSRFPFPEEDLTLVKTPLGNYYTFPGMRPRVEAGASVQPKFLFTMGQIERDGQVLEGRGVVLTGAVFHTVSDFSPLVEQARTLGSAASARAHVAMDGSLAPRAPLAVRQTFRRMQSGAIDPGLTRSLVLFYVGHFDFESRAQFLYDEMVVDEYYSSSADRTGPSVDVFQRQRLDNGNLDVGVRAEDPSGIDRVSVAFMAEQSWESAELALDASGLWHGEVEAHRFHLVQVVDGAGNVTTVDETGRTVRPCAGMCVEGEPLAKLVLPLVWNR